MTRPVAATGAQLRRFRSCADDLAAVGAPIKAALEAEFRRLGADQRAAAARYIREGNR